MVIPSKWINHPEAFMNAKKRCIVAWCSTPPTYDVTHIYEADERHDMDGWEEFGGVNQLFLFRANLANGLGETALATFPIRWI